MKIRERLEPWLLSGMIDPLDFHFGSFIAAADGRPEGVTVGLVAALVSGAARDGHVSLAVSGLAGMEAAGGAAGAEPLKELADEARVLNCLRSSSQVSSGDSPGTPLVLDDAGRIFLQKYFCYQRDFAGTLLTRCRDVEEPPDPGNLSRHLDQCFPPGDENPDPQRQAGLAMLTRKLLILTGGPGTGKTWTIARGIRLMQLQNGKLPTVHLAAPTGKAAARLTEAMREALGEGNGELPAASTLHRLLGPRRNRPGFRHNEENPLPDGLYVIDEVSMLDLTLAARFVRALPPTARLVLVGDRHQLASVEAGALLAEICQAAEGDGSGGPLADSQVQLQHSRRFSPQRGIGMVSHLVNRGRGEEAWAALRNADDDGVSWNDLPEADALQDSLAELLTEAFGAVYSSTDPRQQLEAFGRFRILAGLRGGLFGVKRLNRLVEAALAERGWIRPDGEFYPGRPVMVTANDYQLQLFNGDIGIVAEREGGGRRVFFPDGPGKVREVLPLQLPACETVYAMTVHKSQGSEFDQVLLVLPPESHPVVARELIYTAMTRGKRRCRVWGVKDSFIDGVARRVERHSGLADLLRNCEPSNP